MMYPPIFEVSAASPAVTALLGASPLRLWPFGEPPQNTPLPYAVWQTVSGQPENYLGQRPDADSWSLQVDVYADTATSARNVAKALRDAIEPTAYITRWGGDGRDSETNHYRYSFDVDFIVQR